MSGIVGVVSEDDCMKDALTCTFYLQNRSEGYSGLAWKNDDNKLKNSTHKGLIKQSFTKERLRHMQGNYVIGSVSGNREPVSELSNSGGMMLCYDGNLLNYDEIKNDLLKDNCSFSGYHNPEEICDSVLISKIIAREPDFETGIESLIDKMQGDFAVTALTPQGVYAARGWGRKPLILGKHIEKKSYAVSSESVSFINPGFEIVRDVEPGEVVLLDNEGIHSVKKFDLKPIKYGTFEWVYTAHPASVIDGRSVELARNAIGALLAKRYGDEIDADIVSPIPNSGRCHSTGVANVLSKKLGTDYLEVFKKFDYCGRSFTPGTDVERHEVAEEKLIPVREIIEGKRIVVVDDSIVRGTQTQIQTKRLKEMGAKAVYAMIACPPLMAACSYGKSTEKASDCIAQRMSLDQIRETRGLDGLFYATIEDLEEAIQKPREELCLDCWGEN
ncbi:hypothetical protein GOV14_05075 [Candidatus Pacearchaeota archaeon]|nr:hypothetical protein [Candidatus Pacearchaeota archaeon]